jgi:pseudaminic acid synthase
VKFKNSICINGRQIGPGFAPFIVAEMSGNHNQSLHRALEIVDEIAKTGAHAVKIQTFTPDTMTLDLNEREFKISNEKSLWFGKSLYELYEKAHTPWEWHEAIFTRARERGLIAFSSPFDESSVEFLEGLNAPCYKIASFENTDIALIEKAAATKKPLIISTGMATYSELEDAVRCASEAGCDELILLKCTSTYPADPINTNINTIPDIQKEFGCLVGLSDHTMGVGVSIASISLGACMIEKHFTLSRADGGIDSTFSMEPHEMSQLVAESSRAHQALGSINYGPTAAENDSIQFRRSLYIVKDLKAGEILNFDNVRAIRPGFGLPPKYLNEICGRKLRGDVMRGTALEWDLLV